MACFMENMFYKPQGTIYHKFIHSAADCCFNVEYWISVSTSPLRKWGEGVENEMLCWFLFFFITLILSFLHRKSILNTCLLICTDLVCHD